MKDERAGAARSQFANACVRIAGDPAQFLASTFDGGAGSWPSGSSIRHLSWRNYREAQRARSKAEFISKIGDCLKEQDETQYWLLLLCEAEIVSAKRLQPLMDECNELLAILTAIHKRAKGA
jgi:four helix bundle protein